MYRLLILFKFYKIYLKEIIRLCLKYTFIELPLNTSIFIHKRHFLNSCQVITKLSEKRNCFMYYFFFCDRSYEHFRKYWMDYKNIFYKVYNVQQ